MRLRSESRQISAHRAPRRDLILDLERGKRVALDDRHDVTRPPMVKANNSIPQFPTRHRHWRARATLVKLLHHPILKTQLAIACRPLAPLRFILPYRTLPISRLAPRKVYNPGARSRSREVHRAWFNLWRGCGSGSALNMGILDHSDDDEEEGSHYGGSGGGGRFGARRQKPRAKSQHQLLLMDSVGGGKAGADGDCASEEEIVPLPEYERLSQSARLPDDGDDDPAGAEDPLPPAKRSASLTPLPRQQQQQQKPAAWRLLQYVRSMHRSSAGAVVAGAYCGGSSDGDSKSSDGDVDEEGRKDKQQPQQKKKRSSWLPDPDRRWPVQGFY